VGLQNIFCCPCSRLEGTFAWTLNYKVYKEKAFMLNYKALVQNVLRSPRGRLEGTFAWTLNHTAVM